MTTSSKRFAKALSGVAVCALAGLGGNAFAVQTWSDLDATCSSGGYGYALSAASAAGNCGSGLNVTGISTGYGSMGATTSSTSTFYTASVYDWGSYGLGVVASNEDPNATGPHETDNKYGTDAILLTFGNGPVSLGSFTVGWNGTDNASTTAGVTYNDSDVSVLAWTGSGAPTGSPVQPLSGGALAAGWKLVGNYSNVGSITSPVNTATVSTSVVSSYWLISAYNSAYGAAQNGVTISDSTVDSFKLVGIATTPKATVPEPGSLALMALGLVGMGALRRRQLAAKEATQEVADKDAASSLALSC